MGFADILDKGFMQETEVGALKVIGAERDRYKVVKETIMGFCKDKKLMVSNKYVLTDRAGDAENVQDTCVHIYSTNPLRHANELANLIHERAKADESRRYTRMKTLTENEEFLVEYDLRRVALLFKVQKYKGSEPREILKPVEIQGVLYMPGEIELINVYHTLYNPAKEKEWPDACRYEGVLFDQVVDRNARGILGGKSCAPCKQNILEAAKISLVRDWLVDQEDLMLIGFWARDWLKAPGPAQLPGNREKVQLIGNVNPKALLQRLKTFMGNFTKFNVTTRPQELNLPKDFRTVRWTYYVGIQGMRGVVDRPFLDLFNSAEFEVVPCQPVRGLRLGARWVLLRFLFIDLWVVRFLREMGRIDAETLKKKVALAWSVVEYIRDQVDPELLPAGPREFLGMYRDAMIDKKIASLGSTKSLYPYYPGLYLVDKGGYRKL